MNERSRLLWKCRRGTRELDTVFGRFLERGYDELDAAGRAAFERLLDLEDDELQAYFLSDRRPTDGELARLVEQIRTTR